jgi:hypothetical protein
MPLGYSAADDLPSDESGRRPLKATSELDGLARPQARAHKEAEEDGGAAAAHSDASSRGHQRSSEVGKRSSSEQAPQAWEGGNTRNGVQQSYFILCCEREEKIR